jgi:hypothetical protein
MKIKTEHFILCLCLILMFIPQSAFSGQPDGIYEAERIKE